MDISFLPNGEMRAIVDDTIDVRTLGALPRRASRVEVVECGPHRGKYHVDMSLLADISGNDTHRVCLLPTYVRYRDAIAAEIAWLRANWLTSSTGDKT
jgi:hypothetical protein